MRIAVIGGGIGGLASALILKQKYEVDLFEAEPRLGGHAHTVDLKNEFSESLPVDTGFLVYNELTYPHFTQLLKYLNVETVDSNMSLAIQTKEGIEWSGTNLATVFTQKRNLLKPRFISMLVDILKFHRQADENLFLAQKNSWTIEELLKYRRLGPGFINWYLLPMTGAIWSMSFQSALSFPAQSFMQFCINHRLLQVENRPVWKTILNGSRSYVNKIEQELSKVYLNHTIQNLKTRQGKLVFQAHGQEHVYDKVVLATSAPISHQILQQNFSQLAERIKNFKTSENRVVLHKDLSAMPKRKRCWSSWNVKSNSYAYDAQDIELTYYLNKLQPLKTQVPHFITLNSSQKISHIEREFLYHHPQFDSEALKLQRLLPDLQGENGIYYAGAWTRYGFHEDGILSAVNVSKCLGVDPPWSVQ